MNTQPEALRLADELEMWTLGEPAAAELRRLHTENVELREAVKRAVQVVRIEQAQPVATDVQKALRRAYQLGQNYWADADSESYSANKRADKHRQDFEALCEQVLAHYAPPQRQPLTDEEIRDLYGDNNNFDITGPYVIAFARAIEAAHGIKE